MVFSFGNCMSTTKRLRQSRLPSAPNEHVGVVLVDPFVRWDVPDRVDWDMRGFFADATHNKLTKRMHGPLSSARVLASQCCPL